MPRVAALVMEHFLQKINYKYNIRGWLTHINELNHLDAHPGQFDDLFAFKINYNTVDNSLNDKIKPLYNGNISETFWQTASDGHIRKYGYKYDQINRLQEAIFQRPGFSPLEYNSYNESLWYDKNGNITRLYRTGEVEDAMEYLEIDDLTYLYDDVNKNQLRIVDDSTNNPKGFKDDDTDPDPLAIDDTIDYDYDDYGNMISDTNKGISEITYNHLNLPIKIVLSNGIIEYLYNAAGVKVQKTVTLDSEIHTTDYQSGYQYKDGQLQFFPHAEGYVNVLEENYFNYVYHYTDHLGNIRVSYGIDPESFDLVILEENHYYPFGMKHANYNVGMRTYIRNNMGQIELPLVSEVSYKYKYNGKEWQDELSLNWYDYQARNYDPALGRWMNIDPLAEVSRRWSPYTYCYNNPIVFVDPDGMLATPSDDIYLNARNGEVLGVDADGNNGIVRVIDGVDWDDTVARNGGSTSGASTTELRNSSSVVTVNDAQIQSDINSANNETIGDQTKERQVYIGLSVNMDG
ncbi:MAG: RHS repeat-associated core domain-containing protein, partial [Flavobacterium sp.]|nr:RHS repeat-associated core domain-containing protein [Flavobacterium sp.]